MRLVVHPATSGQIPTEWIPAFGRLAAERFNNACWQSRDDGSYSDVMIGTLDVVVLDCPDPDRLADFYAEMLGMRKFADGPDWAEIVGAGGGRPIIAFQRVDGYTAPEWPGQVVPQQMHLDVKVDDLDAGEAAVLALGATRAGSETPTFRVYLDPAGHPFCLIKPND